MADPRVLILAGPNGAGKTSAARSLLADTLGMMTFVNADAIAVGLSAFDPESVAFTAGRVMLARIHELAAEKVDFAFETTLSARTYVSWLGQMQADGYRLLLFYVWLEDADLAIRRVAIRVSQGGHSIPEGTIRQRYARSLANFHHLYRPLVDDWIVYDNSLNGVYRLVAEGTRDGSETVHDTEIWARFCREVK
jgi:predicted ABC-type ATPase